MGPTWQEDVDTPIRTDAVRPAVFLSYDHRDSEQVADFADEYMRDVGPVWSVGVTSGDNFVHHDDHQLMGEIARRYVRDAAVTVVLVGATTWQRRFVDWEIAASVAAGRGVIGVVLDEETSVLPERLSGLVGSGFGFVHRRLPTSGREFADWIAAASKAAEGRAPAAAAQRELLRRDLQPSRPRPV